MTTTVKDKYDEAMEYLQGLSDPMFEVEKLQAWAESGAHAKAGSLFRFCTPNGRSNGVYGCLTMVRNGWAPAWTSELTEAIQEDARIPIYSDGITKDNLYVFAEWQRRLDKEIRGERSHDG